MALIFRALKFSSRVTRLVALGRGRAQNQSSRFGFGCGRPIKCNEQSAAETDFGFAFGFAFGCWGGRCV